MKQINEKLLNFALESLMKDKISVIPVGKNKIPLIPWKIYQERYATEDEVRGWFNGFEDPQIGFVTGKISNLLVIDIEKGGDPSFLPQNTTIVGTGGGGYHYYFLFEEGIMNKARIRPLTDWRGEGGYVVSPNSVSEKGPYSLLQKVPLLKFPKELFPAAVDIFQTPGVSVTPVFDKSKIENYSGFGEGQRNSEMTKYIGYILTKVHPADWDNEGWTIVQQANLRNIPPLPQKELLVTFESVKRLERQNNPLGHVRSPRNASQGLSWGDARDEKPIILSDGSDAVKHIAEVAEEQKLNQSEIYPLQMKCFDEAILGGVNLGDVVVIAGQTGQGKTSLAQDWTISLVRGEKKVKALWFSYEVLVSHLWKKFQEMGMTREDCVFIPSKHTDGNVAWIESKIKEGKEKFGIKAVFIDHLGFLLPKTNGILGKNLSANYASFLTQVMRDLKTLALKEEIIIFLPVHMKKGDYHNKRADIDDIKDSSGVGQESDLVFLIEREKDRSENAKTYFTDTTRITLAKNRKTGITVVGEFTMVKGRFAYDDTKNKLDEEFESFGEKKEEVVKSESISVPVQAKIEEIHPGFAVEKDDDELEMNDVIENALEHF